ncbi:hypothetical protein [Radiobacillus sp. PE A8.2]|uniref:hypothetical protein n=1 Tax=Radiobacillus sp. PE A8.2 TaxID=3380349 RepID=UPI00388EE6D4
MNKYELYIKELFSNPTSVMLGQELTNNLMRKFIGLKADYARKIIQRAVSNRIINSSSPITFGKKQYAYYNRSYKLDYNSVLKLCKNSRPPIYRLLSIIKSNKGIISYYEALKITGSPLKKSSSKISQLGDIINTLSALDIIEITKDSRNIIYIIDSKKVANPQVLIDSHFDNMTIDAAFLPDLLRWLQNHNLIDNKNIVFRNKNKPTLGATHNNFVWDAFAYTNTTGLSPILHKNSTSEEKKTLVVIDVVISRKYTIHDLEGFIGRIQVVRNSVKTGVRKILPIVIYKNTSFNVTNKIKAYGLLNFNLGTVYGEKIYEIIENFQLVKSHEFLGTKDYVKKMNFLLSSIRDSGQENNLQNIKGDLFESLMYPVVSGIYPASSIVQSMDLRKIKDVDEKEYYEYDYVVYSHNQNEIVIFEMKGLKSSTVIPYGDYNTKYTVKWFTGRTLPFAKKVLKCTSDMPVKGCYITTAKFDEESLKNLKELNKGKLKPNQLDFYYDGEMLLSLLEKKGLANVKKIVQKYYIE